LFPIPEPCKRPSYSRKEVEELPTREGGRRRKVGARGLKSGAVRGHPRETDTEMVDGRWTGFGCIDQTANVTVFSN